MPEKRPVITADGSHTLFSPGVGEHYHSTHGAIQESLHIFIGAGFHVLRDKAGELNILEIGFGTGLNCLLSLAESETYGRSVRYTAIEPYPVGWSIAQSLNYCQHVPVRGYESAFSGMHRFDEGEVRLTPGFMLTRIKRSFDDSELEAGLFHLVYFDAFSPEAQPELWKPGVFFRVRELMQPQGVLVTYCAKGAVRRALQQAGFVTERLQGPPGKREIIRATAT